MIRVLVCGGRDYHDLERVALVLNPLHKEFNFVEVISGCADGADLCGLIWARSNYIPTRIFPAKWKEFGNAAGPIRNQQMLDEGKPDLVVAFPGGKGTRDMITKAKIAKVEVVEVCEVE